MWKKIKRWFRISFDKAETYCHRKERKAFLRYSGKYPYRMGRGWRTEMKRKRDMWLKSQGRKAEEAHRWGEIYKNGKWLVCDDGQPPVWTAEELGYVYREGYPL